MFATNPVSISTMKRLFCVLPALFVQAAVAGVEVDVDSFGESLGGWKHDRKRAAEYELAGSDYRTYKPEVTTSPDGGIFVSVRIDHRRGFLASDDHASLELSFAADGALASAQSSIAIQGKTISSDLIRGTATAGARMAPTGVDRAVKIGSDLVADLSSKLLRERIVEPGRVSFPAVIRHNYNRLFSAVKYKRDPRAVPIPELAPSTDGSSPALKTNAESTDAAWPASPPKLHVQPYGAGANPALPTPSDS